MEHDGCKMTIEVNDNTFSWETPHWDCGMEDFLEAFYGIMVGATFHPETVLNAMKEFAEERLPNEPEEDDESGCSDFVEPGCDED